MKQTTVSVQGRLIQRLFTTVGRAVGWWTRLEYEGPNRFIEPPALIVANHGFGGIFDLNAFTVAALAERLRPRDDVQFTFLTHQLAWTLGVGPYLEAAGARVATPQSAMKALSQGHYVLVMPGGDLDAGKSFRRRNEIVFGGRTGFAKVALDAGVPIIPIVMSGAGETLLVLWDGQPLAKLLRLPKLARTKTLPVSLSVPYGLSVGVAGILPYFPLPAKMRAAVLDPIEARSNETPSSLAERVEKAMQAKLEEQTNGRVPFLGVKWSEVFDFEGRMPYSGGSSSHGPTKSGGSPHAA